MGDIAEFILARIAEDEAVAQLEDTLRDGNPRYYDPAIGREASAFEQHFTPTIILAQCAAFRAIVAANPQTWRPKDKVLVSGSGQRMTVTDWRPAYSGGEPTRQKFVLPRDAAAYREYLDPVLSPTLLALARIWSGHPDFEEAWRDGA